METDYPNQELLDHLCQSYDLPLARASHLLGEILGYFDENCTDYVQRRHRELKQTGLTNPKIYEQISLDLRSRRFPAEILTERQIRRIIYG